MNSSSQLENINRPSKEYLFCPNVNCLNVPEIYYSFNPIKTEVKYKCICNNNYNTEIKMALNEFLEKSHLICNECRKAIIEQKFLFCKNCNNYIHFDCGKNHFSNNKHIDFEFTDKNNLLNFCKEHKSILIFRCLDCKESFCWECERNNHSQEKHSMKKIIDLIDNSKNIEIKNSILNKQKTILNKIKNINNAFIEKFENDIKIKEKVINSFLDNKSNYNSIENLNNLFLKNNERYENILLNFIKEKEEKEKNNNDELDIDKYTDEILLPFYYSMMINKDDALNNSILEKLENKIQKLKNDKSKHFENQNSIKNNNINGDFNSEIIQENNFDIQSSDGNQQYSSNSINSNNKEITNNQIEKHIKNNEFSLFSPKNDISIVNSTNSKIKEDENDNTDKNNNQKKVKKNNNLSDNKKSNGKNSNKKEKNKKAKVNNNDKDINIRNNMIVLEDGNFAISIKKKVEIYNFKNLNSIKTKDFVEKRIIEECLLQEILLDKKGKGRFIDNIFQFTDKTLFCSIYSKLIRIRLLNEDMEHEIIGCIILEEMELVRKMISLGDSLLVTLSDKGKHCKIKLYSKNDELAKNNLNDYNIINNEFNLICSGIFNNNINVQNNKIFSNEKENLISSDINKKIPEKNANLNNDDIKKDCEFELIIDNINKEQIIWNSMFELIKSKNDENYLYEFILTSNADLEDGEDWIEFYGVKNILGKYKVVFIKRIEKISCSSEPDTICQLNRNYICIGLQDYGLDQKNGFALIDINNRVIYKIIEKNVPIYSLFYLQEKKILLATTDSDNNEPNFFVRAYKFLKNTDEKNKDDYILNEIYNYKSEQIDVIVSIHSLLIPDLNNKIIIITSSNKSNIEIKKAEIQNL